MHFGEIDVESASGRLWSLPQALAHLGPFLSDQAGSAGKSARLTVRCPPVLVARPVVEILVPTLVQLLRNAVEHGIEDPLTRLLGGKPMTSTVRVLVRPSVSTLSITVEDDGAGMTPAAIEAARRACSIDASIADRHVLFAAPSERPGLRRASQRLVAVGGSLRFLSLQGAGTTFRIAVPLDENRDCIIVPAPDALVPADSVAFTAIAGGTR